MQDLTIFKLKGATFSDISIEMNNYDVDTTTYDFVQDVDYFYIGYYKPIKNLFSSVKAQTIAATFKFEYYKDLVWTEFTPIDEGKSFSRSGFITWDEVLESVEINSKTLYYIRITATASGELNGLNMLFANDNDLREHYRLIDEYRGNDTSYVALHQASRKDIVQRIRNSGNIKISSITGNIADLTIWDFLEPFQLRNAAAYLCLSKIFAGVSDNEDGKFMGLSKGFFKEYLAAVNTFLTTIDKNDDGESSDSEQNSAINMTIIKDV